MLRLKLLSVLILFQFILGQFQAHSQGDPWMRINPMPQENPLNDIAYLPGMNRIIAVGDNSTIIVSDNMAVSWSVQVSPGGIPVNNNLHDIFFPDETTGYAAGCYLLKTTNSGNTWDTVILSGNVCVLDLYFTDASQGFIINSDSSIHKTTDGGVNWQIYGDKIPFYGKHISFKNDSYGYITGEPVNCIYKTADAGTTWKLDTLNHCYTNGSIIDMIYINDQTGYLLGGGDTIGGQDRIFVLKTVDEGHTWERIFDGGYYYRLGQ